MSKKNEKRNCPFCHGEGKRTCSSCGGTGLNLSFPVTVVLGFPTPCCKCGGTGKTLCTYCSGTGEDIHISLKM